MARRERADGLQVFFIMLITCTTVAHNSSPGSDHHSIFVVFGGTGDLAARYLWQGIFSAYQTYTYDMSNEMYVQENFQRVKRTFGFLAVGLTKQAIGEVVLNNILSTNITCNHHGKKEQLSIPACESRKSEFREQVKYYTTEMDENFSSLCSQILSKLSDSNSDSSKEVIIYMATPPSAYESILQKVSTSCKGKNKLTAEWKVALEKPFGLDKANAESISEQILAKFREEEIYRVDHYLGKSVVQAILPFRILNPKLEEMLNKDSVDRVEIVLKETVGVEGRVSLYNSLGVLRDIHQNHLTEILTLITMDLPLDFNDKDSICEKKEQLLRQIESAQQHNSLFGQYSDYKNENTILGSNSTLTDKIPTFAATVLKINSPRWRSVKFLLVSGKKLDSRESYVRIIFKNNLVCISNCMDTNHTEKYGHTKQLIFHFGHGLLENPSILISESLGSPNWPHNFQESAGSNLFMTTKVYGENIQHFKVSSVIQDTPAYFSVISNILAGRKEHFVSTRQLLLSWQVWDYLVNARKNIQVYESSDPQGKLNFVMKESHLEFVHSRDDQLSFGDGDKIVHLHGDVAQSLGQTPATFLGRKLVSSIADHLAFLLAREIDKAAETEIQSKGSFHIALSGGSSLMKLFRMLAQSFANLHWHSIHVWQVDERCVPHQDERSNFLALDRELLRFVDIPYSNIHAMPVFTRGRLCDAEFGGAHAYADIIRHAVPNSQFDFIVLGVGADGHTASLFPYSNILHVDSNTLVVSHDEGPLETKQRMTFTLPLINKAKRVAMYVIGSHKHDIVGRLEDDTASVDQFPVLGVNPVNGTVTWFVDYSAYNG